MTVVLTEFAEYVPGFGTVSGDRQGDHVVRGWQEGNGGALVHGWVRPFGSSSETDP
ncbi:hypothetical protein Smic_22930 [Streptomyces microflavus]|uniref:Uncharacterized protein n=1 Tax=Streptomyces microflavus TaxID=1919 RepID=A0A7J0CPV3_STRMI|nr:hypothetical protein Smic_22930 [Streptomyces microflavus]